VLSCSILPGTALLDISSLAFDLPLISDGPVLTFWIWLIKEVLGRGIGR
jgi:hypothetical protein